LLCKTPLKFIDGGGVLKGRLVGRTMVRNCQRPSIGAAAGVVTTGGVVVTGGVVPPPPAQPVRQDTQNIGRKRNKEAMRGDTCGTVARSSPLQK